MCDAVIITTIIIQQSWLIRVWPTDAVGSETEMLASACRGRFFALLFDLVRPHSVHDSLRASERARSMSEPAVETNGQGPYGPGRSLDELLENARVSQSCVQS